MPLLDRTHGRLRRALPRPPRLCALLLSVHLRPFAGPWETARLGGRNAMKLECSWVFAHFRAASASLRHRARVLSSLPLFAGAGRPQLLRGGVRARGGDPPDARQRRGRAPLGQRGADGAHERQPVGERARTQMHAHERTRTSARARAHVARAARGAHASS
eukprot:1529354-Pleurochrysis_carterae.AAC.1